MSLDTSPTRKPLTEQLDELNANMPARGMPVAMACRLIAEVLDEVLNRIDWPLTDGQQA